jgi:hypothetical protein
VNIFNEISKLVKKTMLKNKGSSLDGRGRGGKITVKDTKDR